MQAASIDILVQRAGFTPPVAFAVAEAINMTLQQTQVVTVPILDGRLEAFRADLRGEMKALRGELVGEMKALRGELGGELKALEFRMEARFQKMQFQLIFWIVAATVGQSLLPELGSLLQSILRAAL